MSTPRSPILVADDIKANLVFLERYLNTIGYDNILACQDSFRVMGLLEAHSPEIILLDLKMPHPDGATLLVQIRSLFPEIPVIIVTDVHDIKTAVQCMRSGAFDYIAKPLDMDLFRITVNRAIAFRNLQRENRDLKKAVLSLDDLDHPEAFTDIITTSPNMVRIFQYIEAVAQSPEPVLITGETGVGKELAARVIHRLSGRNGDLVPVNAAGLDDTMFSDTLFGHISGAFSGADNPRKGLVESAENGTLFLDEIGDLSPQSQVKLLRLLQENEYMPLGMDRMKRSTARIIVATNENLWERQKKGQFRKDLIFRLKTHHIHLPALKERPGDVPLLLNHFIDLACERLNRKRPAVSPLLVDRLETYAFPGNIRELQAMVFDAMSRNNGETLTEMHFNLNPELESPRAGDPSRHSGKSGPIPFPDPLPTLREAGDYLVNEAMKRARGNQTRAAALLGISQPALNRRLKIMAGENP